MFRLLLYLERNNLSLELSRLTVTTEEEEFTRHHGITTNYTPLLVLGKSLQTGPLPLVQLLHYCALIGRELQSIAYASNSMP